MTSDGDPNSHDDHMHDTSKDYVFGRLILSLYGKSGLGIASGSVKSNHFERRMEV